MFYRGKQWLLFFVGAVGVCQLMMFKKELRVHNRRIQLSHLVRIRQYLATQFLGARYVNLILITSLRRTWPNFFVHAIRGRDIIPAMSLRALSGIACLVDDAKTGFHLLDIVERDSEVTLRSRHA
jgi:hypothetical protein